MALIDKETIRAEIERRKNTAETMRERGAYIGLLDYLDTIPEQPVEETPEPYTGVYDEAYLMDKIRKATESWKGIDTDKMLAECRGYEQPVEGLEEAAVEYADNARRQLFTKDYAISSIADYDHGCIDGFIAGAEWQKAKMRWHSVEESLPKMDEEVIVLKDKQNTGLVYEIAFGHLVDKRYAIDYNGWNIPGVKFWMPMPKIPENK